MPRITWYFRIFVRNGSRSREDFGESAIIRTISRKLCIYPAREFRAYVTKRRSVTWKNLRTEISLSLSLSLRPNIKRKKEKRKTKKKMRAYVCIRSVSRCPRLSNVISVCPSLPPSLQSVLPLSRTEFSDRLYATIGETVFNQHGSNAKLARTP